MANPTTALFDEIADAMESVSDNALPDLVADEIALHRVELTSAMGSRDPRRVKAANRDLRHAVETLICGCVAMA